MAKFNVLKINQMYMARIGIYSYRLTEQTNEFYKSIAAYYICFFLIGLSISTCVFVFENLSNFNEATVAILSAIGGLQAVGMFISIGLKMKKVKVLHLKLQEIVDKYNDGDIVGNFWKQEQKCQQFTRALFLFVFLDQTAFLAGPIMSIYDMFNGNFDTSTWNLPMKLVVPFNTQSIFGWYSLWFIETNIGIVYSLCVTSITSYFVSCCFYINGICDHFNLLVKSTLNDLKQIQTEKNPRKKQKASQQLMDKFSQAVEIHAEATE